MPAKTQPAPKLYTVAEAALQLQMGRSTLYRLIAKNRVPHRVMPTGVVRFTDQDIKQVFDEAARPPIQVRSARRAA
jgi:excisionase family DNA binding protein